MKKKSCCVENLSQKYDQRLFTMSLGLRWVSICRPLLFSSLSIWFLVASFNVSPRCNYLLDCSRKYFILWDIVNPQFGSGLGLGLGLGLGSGLRLGLGSDSVRGSSISHKMKYLPLQLEIKVKTSPRCQFLIVLRLKNKVVCKMGKVVCKMRSSIFGGNGTPYAIANENWGFVIVYL